MSSRGKILILWSDTNTMQSIQDQLAGDFEINITQDLADGYQQALGFQPDCILSDTYMDSLKGRRMLTQIRNIPGLESMGVLLISDSWTSRYASPGVGLDVDLCIAKPYLIEEVTAGLIGMIQIHKRCQKLLSAEYISKK